jgi:UDP-3-O-[3-hydroxymyristoyl] glucosamine N-acyltransferase
MKEHEQLCCKGKHFPSNRQGYEGKSSSLKQGGEDVAVANNVVVGVNSLITAGLVVAEDVVVGVAQTLASAGLYINVTNDMLVTVS